MTNSNAAYADNAWLYDAAFCWDLGDEPSWVLARLGPEVDSILEPGCGSGRLLAALAKLGATAAGVDNSSIMLERARARFTAAGLAPPQLVRADLADFELGAAVAGAVCPISTFGYLTSDEDAMRHLECVARHLRPQGRYLVQLGLRNITSFELLERGPHTVWETRTEDGTLRTAVFGTAWDEAARIETQTIRYEFLDGAKAGLVIEESHEFQIWSWDSWSDLIAASPFGLEAAWDGNQQGRPALPLGQVIEDYPGAWHCLAART